MRIAQLGKFYPPHPGGIEEYVAQVAGILGAWHDVCAVVFNEGRQTINERIRGVRVVRVGSQIKLRSQPFAAGLPGALAAFCPDIIHVHTANPFATYVCEIFFPRTPVIVTHHADIVRYPALRHVVMPAYRRQLARAQAITVLSPRNAEHSRDLRGFVDRCQAIPHAIDVANYTDDPAVRAHAAELRTRTCGDAPALGFVGRHVPYKGLHVLVEALARLPEVHALVAGEGPCTLQIEAQAEALGVAGRLHLLGRIDESTKHALLRAVDLYAFPSLNASEAFGISQVEAQLCSLPILTSRLETGVSEVTRDGETGYCLPPGDATAFADATRRLLNDLPMRLRFGEAARQRALANYSLHVVAKAWQKLYRDIETSLSWPGVN